MEIQANTQLSHLAEKKEVLIQVRVSPELKRIYEEKAKAAGMTLSDYIRRKALTN